MNRTDPSGAPGPPLPFDPAEAEGTVVERLTSLGASIGGRTALSGGGDGITYAELVDLFQGVARWIIDRHGPGDEPLALMTAHAPVTAVIELAAMAAGRPAMPLDPTMPTARLEHQLGAARPVATVAAGATAEVARRLRGTGPVHVWDRLVDLPTAGGEPLEPEPDDGILVLHTSGTTGEPKGVVLNHRSLLHGSRDLALGGAYLPADVVANTVPLAFGAGVSTTFWPLLAGSQVAFFPLRDQGLPAAVEWMRRDGITAFATVPTVVRAMAAALGDRPIPHLRSVVVGGEAIQPADVALLRRMSDEPVRVVQVYACTELMLMAWGVVEPEVDELDLGAMTVGRPVTGFELGLEPVEDYPGIGEVTVTAPPLNAGYVGRPESTELRAEALTEDRVLYRTGDLGRWTGDGIELVGRRDTMVKVRGSRVELGLVEQALTSAPHVAAAAVVTVASRGGDVALVAHVAGGADGEQPDPLRVRGHLRTNLPPAMVPLRVVVHERLPQLPNGKVDRAALAEEDPSPVSGGVAPRTEMERRLVKRLRLITGLEDLGVTDDLFERGIDSLVAIEILVQVEEEFGVALPASSWIDLATVADLARAVEGDVEDPTSSVVQLQAGDLRRPPLVLTHDLHGSALRFRDLAAALGSDQPVFALESPLRAGLPGAPSTMSAIAAHHTADLVAQFGDGPFHLLGYSWGTMLAVEITRQLESSGRKVGFLGLMDYGPNHLRHPNTGRMRPIPPDGWPEKARSDLPLRRRVAHHVGRVREESPGRRIRYLSKVFGKTHLYDVAAARSDLRRTGRVRPHLRSSYSWHRLVDIAHDYDWPALDHDATVFVSDQTLKRRITVSRKLDYASATEPALGWDRVIRGELVLRDVVGHHNDLVEEPYVAGVGSVIRERFDEWLAVDRAEPTG